MNADATDIKEDVKKEKPARKRKTAPKSADASRPDQEKNAIPKTAAVPAEKKEAAQTAVSRRGARVSDKSVPESAEEEPKAGEKEQDPTPAKTLRRSAGVADKTAAPKPERYFEAVGRRKTAVARVRLFTKPGELFINDRPHTVYFPTIELQKIVEDAMQKMKLWGKFKVTAKIHGGGIHAQAEAFRHGIARCLVKFNADFRKRLKRAGFLTRDSRMKERKKPGLKKARRAPQWRKR